MSGEEQVFKEDPFAVVKFIENGGVKKDHQEYQLPRQIHVDKIIVKENILFQPLPNFKAIDETYRAMFKKEKTAMAASLGYEYISEAVYDLYYNLGYSLRSVSSRLGYEGYSIGIFMRMHRWPRRKCGGPNSAVLTVEQIKNERALFIEETDFKKEAFATAYKRIALDHNVSIDTVRRIIYNHTFVDYEYEKVARRIRDIAGKKHKPKTRKKTKD